MRLKHLLSVFLTLLTLSVGQMWGADPTEDIVLSSGSFSTDHITWSGTSCTIQQLKGTSSTAVNSSYISAPRVYKGHVLSFVAKTGYKIKSISIKVDGTYYGNSMTAGTTISSNTVTNNTTDVSRTWTSTSGGTHVVGSVNAAGLNAIYIQNVASTNVQLRFTKITITYVSSTPSYTVTTSSNNNSWGTVSVSGTTITATPADCYQVASGTSGYNKISGTGTITHTENSNTISVTPTSNCSIQVIFEKKIVNTYIDEIQDNGEFEDCTTSAPSLTDKSAATTGTCAQQHYHFVGWVTAANKANPTDANIIEAGETVAVNGTTYYAVWAKGTGGGSFDGEHGGSFKIYANVSGTNHYATGTGSKISSTTTASDATEYTFTKVTENNKTYFTIKTGNDYITKGSSNTDFGTSTTAYNWIVIEGTHGSWRIVSSTVDTRGFIYRASTYNVFGTYTLNGINGTEYYDLEIGGSTSYSDYITTCCTSLGSINGSVLETTPSGVTLQWDDIANVSGWTVTGVDEDENAVAAGNIGAPTDMGTTYNCAISNLTSGKTYTFTITPTHTSAYCDVYEGNIVNNVTIPYATSTVTFNANGATSGNVPVNITQNTGTKVYVPGNSGNLLKTNYDFAGWNTQDDGEGDNYEEGEDFDLTGNITLYAKWDCAKFVNITKGTPSNGSFNISATGSQYTCDGAAVITLSDITPSAGYRFKEITAPGSTSIDQTNKTVTYAQYANGSSTINVEFEQIPTYTITWSVNGQTSTTNVTDGDALVLPTPAPTVDGCEDGKAFVGWTATAIVGSTDTKPSVFTTAGSAPTIDDDMTFYAVFATPGTEGEEATDVLDRAKTGISNNGSYGTWSGKTATTDAVYAGQSAGGNNSIQLRSDNSNSGIITTTSGGKAKKVTVSWNSGTANGRTVHVYGKNSAYEAATDLYDNNKQGTLLGSIVYNTSTELTISGDYEYIGIRSSSGALYLSSVSIKWETVAGTAESGYITSCTKQVAVTATDGGTATINGEAAVNWTSFETNLALVATPSEGYVFAGWSYDEDIVTIDNDNAAEATANSLGAATITANFVPGSTISADKENLNLVAYVDELDGTATVTFSSSDAPQYGGAYYTITEWSDTENTFITPDKTYLYLSSTSYEETVTISYGSEVAGSFSANLVVTMLNKNSVTVGTKIIPITLTIKPKFTVTAQADVAAHATAISATPNADVKDGTTVTLSQTAADGWIFQKWTISYILNEVAHNEDLVGNTFTMPAANVTATAVYTEKSGTDLTAPTNAAVDDESITSHSALLSWDAVDHASSYTVYVMGEDESVQTIPNITTNSYTVTDLKAETEYYWSVTAIGNGEDYYNSSATNGPDFTTTARILSSIAIKTPATKMNYNEGETFDKTGLEVTATYDDKTTATISANNLVVLTTPLTAGTTSITVSYTENDVLKSTTLEGITVNELGSVTWSANGVTNVVKYAEGQAISFPPSASGCFGKSFVGWSESTIDGETDDAPTLVTSATMGATNKTYYAVFAIVENSNEEKSYGFETNEPDDDFWTVSGPVKDNDKAATGSYAGKINTNNTYVTFKNKVNVTNFSFNFARTSNNDSYNVYIETSADGETWTAVKTVAMSTFDRNGTFSSVSQDFDGENALYVRFHCYNTTAVRYVDDVHIAYSATTGSKYATSCCTPNTITISDAIEHGSVSTGEVTAACEGTEITLSASAAEGYEFKSWTVMQGESDITETNVDGNVLTMPAGNVTVSASFNKIAVTGVTINGAENVQINNDVVWTLDITPEEARPTLVWSTANDAVATVSNGTVHGVAVGSTTITATVDGVPYDKTINVIAATVLNSISISTPQTEFTMGDAFVAPETVTANYIYEVGGAPAPSVDVTASATVSGYNMNVAGEQTVTVSYENKSYQYTINVAPWTLHLQTKRLYGNDVETPTVVDATITTLEAPTALNGYYVTGLCEGYTQLGYITSSENIDALPAEVLTSYTPSANNETLYGVFQKTNYAGVDVLTEDFSSQEAFNANFPTTTGYTSYSSGSVRLGSSSQAGSITSKVLDLSHKFKVEVSSKRHTNDNNVTLYVKVGSTPLSQENLPSSYPTNPYVFEFNGSTTNNTVQIYTSGADKRLDINSIHIYTLDDIEYTSVYDCREPKEVTYEIGNEQVVWTACENTTVMEGQNYTLCANEPSLQGYDFGGWIINGDEEIVKAAGSSIEVAADLTITPKFTEHVYDYQYALAASATNGTIASVTVNGVAKDLAEVALHDGDAVVVTAVPNTNYELSEWTHSENVSLTTDANTASFTVAVGAGDMTIAAVFVEKAQYTMTLNVFGRTYTTKQGHEGDTYSSVLAGAASPAISGYDFQGWSTDAENVNAIISGEELLTADVTLYAIVGSLQPTGYVYNKVTSTDDITNDGYYLIVNEEFGKAFNGALSGKSSIDANGNKVNVTISENQIISNAEIDAAIVTIGPAENEGELYIKTASGYYIGASTNSTGLNANTTTPYGNIFSFEDGNFVVDGLKQVSDKELVLRFNSGAGTGRFGYYGGTQKPIQLYKRGEVHQEIIPEAEPEIVISTEVSASTSFPGGYVGDVTVVNGGSLNADINLSVGDLIIHSTLGKGTGTSTSGNAPGSCGQIINGNNITVTGDAWIEIELTQESAASYGWYAFSVPFRVDAMHGVYGKPDGEDWQELQNEVGYAIMKYHGDVRAQGLYGWKKYRDIMEPGTLYIIAVGKTEYKTLRFKKVADADLVASSTVTLKKYASETNTDAGWNGIGNPNLQISNYATGGGSPAGAYIQFLDHSANAFKNRQRNNVNLVVGSAFFFQYTGENEQTSITINTGAQAGEGNGYLAPKRERNAAEETIYEVELTNVATEEIEDNIFLTAREEALNEYEIGRDVAKMSMGDAKCAQMWIPAYGTQLCAADFQLVNNQAEYPLTINTPKAGTYSISAQENENATIYLTQNGSIIWNLSMSACELDLAQGQNEGYGLKLVINAPAVVTGVDLIDAKADVQKVIIDEHVFILRGGQIYGIDGKIVK